MPRILRLPAGIGLAVLATFALAPAAEAGILIDRDGIRLTDPSATVSRQAIEDGHTRFGSPARGFRRFGRSGFFATPRDQTLPFNGRNAFGPSGRRNDGRTGPRHGPRDSIFTGAIWRWFE